MTADGADTLLPLVEEYLDRRRAGEDVGVEDFITRAGTRSGELRELLLSVELLERTGSSGPLRRDDVLGDFRIVRELGRGGMGIVYEAENVDLQRRVALKVLDTASLADPTGIVRFQREARAAARLHHSNIVPIYGSGSSGNLHYYAMQHIQGCGLDRVLQVLRSEDTQERRADAKWGPIQAAAELRAGSLAMRVRIVAQIADALQYAHRVGVLHRDIKPANVLLSQDGTAWVMDFGVARLLDELDLTRSRQLVGTLRYMAPEQLRGRGDQRSDVFSAGLVLYELLTLETPYGDDDATDLLARIENVAIDAPTLRNPRIPRDLETVVLKALARDPAERYPTAGRLADDLRAFLGHRPVSARRATWPERTWRWVKRNRLVASLGTLTILGLTAATALGVSGTVSTRRALDLAEDNLALAMSGFDGVFESLTGDATSSELSFADRILELSHRDGEALRRLAEFYERFAARNADDAALRHRTVTAVQRVGRIQLHLGDHEEAAAATRRAIALASGLPGTIHAGLFVQLGQALMLARDYAGAREQFERALAVDARERADVLFEHARAHDLMALSTGERGWYSSTLTRTQPTARGEDWAARAVAHHRAAGDILDRLLQARPDELRLLRAQASNLRFQSMLPDGIENGGSANRARLHDRARRSLQALARRMPDAPLVQAELAAVLSDSVHRLDPLGEGSGRAALDQAVAIVRDLLRRFPSAAGVRDLAAEVVTKAAHALERQAPAESLPLWLEFAATLEHANGSNRDGRDLWRSAQVRAALVAARAGKQDVLTPLLDDLASWVDALDAERAARMFQDAPDGPPPGPPPIGDGVERRQPPPGPRPGFGSNTLDRLADLFEANDDAERAEHLRSFRPRGR